MIDVDYDWDAYDGGAKSESYVDRLLDRADEVRDR